MGDTDTTAPAQTEATAVTDTASKATKGPGRPASYSQKKVRAYIARMIAQHGLTAARERLIASTTTTIDDYKGGTVEERQAALEREHALAKERAQSIFPHDKPAADVAGKPISLPTMSNIAKEAGIKLTRGRRKAA